MALQNHARPPVVAAKWRVPHHARLLGPARGDGGGPEDFRAKCDARLETRQGVVVAGTKSSGEVKLDRASPCRWPGRRDVIPAPPIDDEMAEICES